MTEESPNGLDFDLDRPLAPLLQEGSNSLSGEAAEFCDHFDTAVYRQFGHVEPSGTRPHGRNPSRNSILYGVHAEVFSHTNDVKQELSQRHREGDVTTWSIDVYFT